jgi:hypothetical protein
MKTIVTHLNPDLDAIFSIWLIKRFLPGWDKAEVKFVPAGRTLDGGLPDDKPEILHVDTGLGKFDHHQTKKFICASDLVWGEIIKENIKIKDWQKEAIERILVVVREIDHARFLAWPQPDSDRWDFSLYQVFGGLVGNLKDKPEKILEYSFPMIDGLFRIFGEKIEAEEIIENGLNFKTKWGKGIAFETDNSEANYLALKKGYAIVIKKRPKTGHLGIYGNWQKGVKLYKIYLKLEKKDPRADWFYHKSGCMVLNGSTSNPKMKPTKLKLEEIVKTLREEM